MGRLSGRTILGLVVALLIFGFAVLYLGNGGGQGTQHGRHQSSSAQGHAPAQGHYDIIAVADLPPEARQVLGEIRSGGPFEFGQDGSTFHNFERLLPPEPDGFYKEYTVPTPGASTRGARRIIQGADGRLFYTSDHYRTFLLIKGSTG